MKKFLFIMLVFSFNAMAEDVKKKQAEEDALKAKLEKQFNLPPEPDPEINNATINGVDVNNNLIRDDWERAIVFTYHDRPTMMHLHNEYAKNHTNKIMLMKKGDLICMRS